MLERLSKGEQNHFNALEQLVDRAQGDPQAAFSAIADVRAGLTRLRGYLNRTRPERLYKVPFTGGVVVASTGIVPTQPTPFTFPKAGRIIGFRAIVLEDIADVTHVTLSIKNPDGLPFFSNGTSEAFISFAALSGVPFEQGAGWFPFLYERVAPNEQWTFTCSSSDPLPSSGSTTYTPEITLLVELD